MPFCSYEKNINGFWRKTAPWVPGIGALNQKVSSQETIFGRHFSLDSIADKPIRTDIKLWVIDKIAATNQRTSLDKLILKFQHNKMSLLLIIHV